MRTGKTFTDPKTETMTTIAPAEDGAHVTVTDRRARAALFAVLPVAQLREFAIEAMAIADELDPPAPPAAVPPAV